MRHENQQKYVCFLYSIFLKFDIFVVVKYLGNFWFMCLTCFVCVLCGGGGYVSLAIILADGCAAGVQADHFLSGRRHFWL